MRIQSNFVSECFYKINFELTNMNDALYKNYPPFKAGGQLGTGQVANTMIMLIPILILNYVYG